MSINHPSNWYGVSQPGDGQDKTPQLGYERAGFDFEQPYDPVFFPEGGNQRPRLSRDVSGMTDVTSQLQKALTQLLEKMMNNFQQNYKPVMPERPPYYAPDRDQDQPQPMKDLITNYAKADLDKNGFLSKEELLKANNPYGQQLSSHMDELMFANSDGSNNAWYGLSQKDLAKIADRLRYGGSIARVSAGLREQVAHQLGVDPNGDGFEKWVARQRAKYGEMKDGVAALESSSATGDPHIKGADGESFDFHDKGYYSLLSDSGLKVNGNLVPYGNNPNAAVMSETGLRFGNDKVLVNRDGGFQLNGAEVKLEQGKPLTLTDGTVISRQADNTIAFSTKEYNIKLTIAKGSHIDAYVDSKEKGIQTDGVLPTGILGETFDADMVRNANTKQDHSAYKVKNLFS